MAKLPKLSARGITELVEITETITFDGRGGSRHVFTFADGSVFAEEEFSVSPVLMRRSGESEYSPVRADVAQIVRKTQAPRPALTHEEKRG